MRKVTWILESESETETEKKENSNSMIRFLSHNFRKVEAATVSSRKFTSKYSNLLNEKGTVKNISLDLISNKYTNLNVFISNICT